MKKYAQNRWKSFAYDLNIRIQHKISEGQLSIS